MNESVSLEAIVSDYELLSLAKARKYQSWLRDLVAPYLGQRILELGAGIGNMSQHLPQRELLVLAEVEPAFLKLLEQRFSGPEFPKTSIQAIDSKENLFQRFHDKDLDTVVSFNVLEHIEDDAKILSQLLELLAKSRAMGPKRIVTLVPAHGWAYGTIDRELHHFRRYTAASFAQTLLRANEKKIRLHSEYQYVNIPGLFVWFLVNRVFRFRKLGTNMIRVFESLYPVIRPLDDFLHQKLKLPFGQSLLAVVTIEEDK